MGGKLPVLPVMMNLRLPLAALALTCLLPLAHAQDVWPCGQSEAQAAFDAAHPGARAAREAAEAQTRAAAQDVLSRGGEDDELYIIPVVFHVIHDNGPENISNAQIEDAMEILNRDFRLMNPDTGQIVAGFVDIAADVDIEFRLPSATLGTAIRASTAPG